MKNVYLTLCLFCCFVFCSAKAQLMNDDASQNTAGQVLDKIYNWDFQASKVLIESLKPKYGKHPVVPFLQAVQVSWEYMPLEKEMPQFVYFSQHLQLTVQYAKKLLDKDKEDLEGNYFTMLAYSLLALYESESGDFLQSVNYGKRAFGYMKKGFTLGDKYPEFHFSTGLYKYYAVQYPETHPIARPFMAFFPNGDKKQGLEFLNKAVQLARFSRTEALIYLASIYAKYEKNYYQSLICAQQLIGKFPNNPLFWAKYCEHLIHLGRYAEAELYLSKFNTRQEKIYKVAGILFKGLIQEKYYRNEEKAKAEYLKVINSGKYDARYTKDYHAFAYCGLARLSDKVENKTQAKDYYKKALKIGEYEELKAEAKEYLRGN